MRFLYPTLFWAWAPLVLVPILLYLFRPRPRTVRTSTLPFFKWLAREHQDAAWLKWLKHLLSLLLSILVIAGAAAALARLVVAPPAESLKTVVILVDRSASMSARDPDGQSRLDEAVARARQRLAGLPAGVGVIVMTYDRRPEVLLSRCLDLRQVHRALSSIELRPIAGDAAAALRMARRLAALETPAGIWHLTDAKADSGDRDSEAPATAQPQQRETPAAEKPNSPDGPAGVTVEHLSVALPKPTNVGITAFRLRRRPLERSRFEAFVQIHGTASEPIEAELEMQLDGKLVQLRKLTLQPHQRQKLLTPPIDAHPNADRVLTLTVSAPGDVMAIDNVVHARIPRLRPVSVLWISESPDPFTELALSSLGADGDLEVLQGLPKTWPPKEPADVTIFDGWLPEKWPAGGSVIAINPPGSLGPIQAMPLKGAGLPLDTLRAPGQGHPVLYGVATGRIALTQTAVVEADGPLESLLVGSAGPVLLAGEARGQRIVVLPFDPQTSERLPLMYSYPLLVGNAIYWAAENRLESARGMNLETGELIELQGRRLTWQDPDVEESAPAVELTGRAAELDRIGLWETDADERGSAALLSVTDTLLPARAEDAQNTEDANHAAASLFRGDLAPVLLWGVLVLLIVESWLYHRYLAY